MNLKRKVQIEYKDKLKNKLNFEDSKAVCQAFPSITNCKTNHATLDSEHNVPDEV